MTLDSWAFAAAMLTTEQEIHCKELALRIVDTGLANLGRTGKTPWKTLRVELSKRPEFASRTRGYFSLKDRESALQIPAVRQAKFALAGRKDTGLVRKQIKQLVQRNELLERKLTEIAEICNPVIGV